ncbi:MAG: O-antigen ligase family protein [Planctomycetota bacterium]
MFTESPGSQSVNLPANLNDTVYSLLMSTVLIISLVVWFVTGFFSKRFSYRLTGIEIGLLIFSVAAIIGVFSAANKRAAITNFVTLLAPILMAVLLVQILDSQVKIKLMLAVIAALGVVSAYQCAEQFFVSNQMTIEQYEQNRLVLLEPLGIQPGTFAHFLFEHRLYTKGVRGFFTTSNSAGSFALLASFAAIGLFVDKLKNRKYGAYGPLRFVSCGIAVAIVIFGFAITRSRGAIMASLAATAMFIAFLLFRNWLNKYKKAIFIVCLLSFVAVLYVVIRYGISHGRLPGGNSMMVRWQYWRGAAQMYIDHPVTGVGGGNFGSFYAHYKAASALETVVDPHNFLLSITTQYGPLGFIGFLAVVSLPLWRAVSRQPVLLSSEANQHEPAFTKAAIPFVIVISAALLLIRPILSPIPPISSFEEKYAAIIVLYVFPVIVFIFGFLLLTGALISNKTDYMSIAAAALFCACVGVLIHNLIDFAIFEPGVFTAFWAVMASVIALDYQQKSRQQFVRKPARFAKVLVTAGGLVVIWAHFNYAFVPVARASENIKRAMQGIGYTHEYLDQAAKDDALDPTPPNMNGRLYLQQYNNTAKKQTVLLEKAAKCFLTAVERNKADFKNYEKLSQVYRLLGDTQQAYNCGLKAAKRYPGSGRLQFNLAEIAEKLGKITVAIEHYKEAVIIEDKYSSQFRQMYPGREIISRLGEEKYKKAKQRIEFLTRQSTL